MGFEKCKFISAHVHVICEPFHNATAKRLYLGLTISVFRFDVRHGVGSEGAFSPGFVSKGHSALDAILPLKDDFFVREEFVVKYSN